MEQLQSQPADGGSRTRLQHRCVSTCRLCCYGRQTHAQPPTDVTLCPQVWLVLQLCSGGNLQDSFKQRNDAFNMPRLLCRLAEVAQGMAYLHSRNICHGVSEGSAVAARGR